MHRDLNAPPLCGRLGRPGRLAAGADAADRDAGEIGGLGAREHLAVVEPACDLDALAQRGLRVRQPSEPHQDAGIVVQRDREPVTVVQLSLDLRRPLAVGRGDIELAAHRGDRAEVRQDDREARLYNIVGFQTKMTYSEQRRVLRMIPGLARAEFVRLGSLHRNTFIDSPGRLMPTMELRARRGLLLAGQMIGVEGYVESAAAGLLACLWPALRAARVAPMRALRGE